MRPVYIVLFFVFLSSAVFAAGGFTTTQGNATPPRSTHTDECQRSCENGTPGLMVKATLVDPTARRRSTETVNLYRAVPPPPIVCRCKSAPLPDRNDDDRRTTASQIGRCINECRSGENSATGIVVELDGREHVERICALDFMRSIACLCTQIPIAPRARSKNHDPI